MNWLKQLMNGEERDYSEIRPIDGESKEQYAARKLAALLPTLHSRNEALEYLYLCYPRATQENTLYSIAACLYFLRMGAVEGSPP